MFLLVAALDSAAGEQEATQHMALSLQMENVPHQVREGHILSNP